MEALLPAPFGNKGTSETSKQAKKAAVQYQKEMDELYDKKTDLFMDWIDSMDKYGSDDRRTKEKQSELQSVTEEWMGKIRELANVYGRIEYDDIDEDVVRMGENAGLMVFEKLDNPSQYKGLKTSNGYAVNSLNKHIGLKENPDPYNDSAPYKAYKKDRN